MVPLAIVCGAVLIVGGILYGLYAGGVFEGAVAGHGGSASGAGEVAFNQKAWPPAEGAPENTAYGNHPGESIAPVADDNVLTHLLRRRAVDPWIRIANPRWEKNAVGWDVLKLDVEIVDPPPAGQMLIVEIRDPEQPSDDWRATGQPIIDLLKSGRAKGKVELVISGPKTVERPYPADAEIRIVSLADDYHLRMTYRTATGTRLRQGAPRFKVSNSLTMGAVSQVTPAREWTKEEYAHFTGPADHGQDNPAEMEHLTQEAIASANAPSSPDPMPTKPVAAEPRAWDDWKMLDPPNQRFNLLVPPGTMAAAAQSGQRLGKPFTMQQFTGLGDGVLVAVEFVEFPEGRPERLEELVLSAKFDVLTREAGSKPLSAEIMLRRVTDLHIDGLRGRAFYYTQGTPPKLLQGETSWVLGPDFVLTVTIAGANLNSKLQQEFIDSLKFGEVP